jgi:anti-sigma regulatory factor (Ser/Thr protein kinase)
LPGATLLAYTDGLVERRDQPIDAQIGRVCDAVVSTLDLPVDEVADVVLDGLAPADGYEDDVAIVVYRRPHNTLVIDNDARADRLGDIRHRLSVWLRAANVPEPLAGDIVLAVNEACSNSAEHAYRTTGHKRMRVEATIDAGHIAVHVSDTGSWKPPSVDPHTRGRGLPLIRALSERVDIDGTATGTRIDMTFRMPQQR